MGSIYDKEKAKKEQKIKEAEKKLDELTKKLKEASKEEKEDIKNRMETVKKVIFTNKGFLKVLKYKHGVEESLSNKEIIENLKNLVEAEQMPGAPQGQPIEQTQAKPAPQKPHEFTSSCEIQTGRGGKQQLIYKSTVTDTIDGIDQYESTVYFMGQPAFTWNDNAETTDGDIEDVKIVGRGNELLHILLTEAGLFDQL